MRSVETRNLADILPDGAPWLVASAHTEALKAGLTAKFLDGSADKNLFWGDGIFLENGDCIDMYENYLDWESYCFAVDTDGQKRIWMKSRVRKRKFAESKVREPVKQPLKMHGGVEIGSEDNNSEHSTGHKQPFLAPSGFQGSLAPPSPNSSRPSTHIGDRARLVNDPYGAHSTTSGSGQIGSSDLSPVPSGVGFMTNGSPSFAAGMSTSPSYASIGTSTDLEASTPIISFTATPAEVERSQMRVIQLAEIQAKLLAPLSSAMAHLSNQMQMSASPPVNIGTLARTPAPTIPAPTVPSGWFGFLPGFGQKRKVEGNDDIEQESKRARLG